MRASRMTNEQLATSARFHRKCADQEMPNPACHKDRHIELAEVFEELLDHRLKLGEG